MSIFIATHTIVLYANQAPTFLLKHEERVHIRFSFYEEGYPLFYSYLSCEHVSFLVGTYILGQKNLCAVSMEIAQISSKTSKKTIYSNLSVCQFYRLSLDQSEK